MPLDAFQTQPTQAQPTQPLILSQMQPYLNEVPSPSTQQPSPPSQQKRKRVSQACDTCRRRKQASQSDLNATDQTQTNLPKPKGPRALYVESLKTRLKDLEARAASKTLQQLETHPVSSSSTVAFGSSNPISLSLNPDDSPVPLEAQRFLHIDLDALPEEIYVELAEPLNFFQRRIFLQDLQAGVHPPMLLNAMFALSARFSPYAQTFVNIVLEAKRDGDDQNDEAPPAPGDAFYCRARRMVMRSLEVPSIPTTQSLLLLSIYSVFRGKVPAGLMYANMAITMADSLELSVDPDLVTPNLNWMERETRRRVWWACYMWERYLMTLKDRTSLKTPKAKPPHLQPSFNPNLKLPISEKAWDSIRTKDEEPPAVGLNMPTMNGSPLLLGGATAMPKMVAFSDSLHGTGDATVELPDEYKIIIYDDVYCAYILLTNIFGRVWELYTSLRVEDRILDMCRKSSIKQQHITHGTFAPGQTVFGMYISQVKTLDAQLRNWYASLSKRVRLPGELHTLNTPTKMIRLSVLQGEEEGAADDNGQAVVPSAAFSNPSPSPSVSVSNASSSSAHTPIVPNQSFTNGSNEVPIYFCPDLAAMDPSWMSAFLHIFYRTVRIMLYLPSIVEALAPEGSLSPATPVPSQVTANDNGQIGDGQLQHLFFHTHLCAMEVTNIIRNTVQQDLRSLEHMPGYAGLCIFHAGLFHALVCIAGNTHNPVDANDARNAQEDHYGLAGLPSTPTFAYSTPSYSDAGSVDYMQVDGLPARAIFDGTEAAGSNDSVKFVGQNLMHTSLLEEGMLSAFHNPQPLTTTGLPSSSLESSASLFASSSLTPLIASEAFQRCREASKDAFGVHLLALERVSNEWHPTLEDYRVLKMVGDLLNI
ncbi:hypothetical protein HK102_002064 [Quaeritorhiza haematococci]|nr:hypothetical protein HK102_002064 [Quaeritorhiza haematococci]